MIYILLGTIGFLIVHLFDLVSLKRIPLAKPATWALGSSLLVYSVVMASLQSDRLPLPTWSTWLGWLLLLVSLLILGYSLFGNLPFRKTYVAMGVPDKLIKTGLYALARHPGVFCFILVMLSLLLISRSSLLLMAAPIWIIADILLVVIQDRFFFGRMFPGYDRYRQETPMLLPNRKSINTSIGYLRKVSAK